MVTERYTIAKSCFRKCEQHPRIGLVEGAGNSHEFFLNAQLATDQMIEANENFGMRFCAKHSGFPISYLFYLAGHFNDLRGTCNISLNHLLAFIYDYLVMDIDLPLNLRKGLMIQLQFKQSCLLIITEVQYFLDFCFCSATANGKMFSWGWNKYGQV